MELGKINKQENSASRLWIKEKEIIRNNDKLCIIIKGKPTLGKCKWWR